MTASLPAVQTDPAPGHRGLILLAKNPHTWTIDGAFELVCGCSPDLITASAMAIRDELATLPADKDIRASWEKAMDERLRRLAIKIAPGMSVAQGAEWRKVMVEALSDLPAMVGLTAAKRAVHTPMTFMNEVEPAIRAIAKDLIDRRRLALMRLDRLREAMARAAQPKIPDRIAEPLTPAEIRAMSPEMRRIGLKTGALTQDELDQAMDVAA